MIDLFFSLVAFAAGASAPLTFQLPAEPDTLDPLHVSDVIGFNIVSNVNEGLVRLDGEGKLKNGLASSHKISRDGRVYRFRIKPEAKWSDGKAVTIEDFLYGLRLARDPKTAARDASYLAGIKEARKAGGELVIELSQPQAGFLQVLTMPLAGPAREDIRANGGWKPTSPSTGPYRVAVAKADREVRLEPNPFYPSGALPVTFKVIAEESTALNLFEAGQLDAITTISTTELDRLEKAKLLRAFPSAASFYLGFNLTKPPFADPRWRKALAAAVNRANLVRISPSTIQATTNYLPSALAGAGAPLRPDFSSHLNLAKKQKAPEIVLVYPASALASLLAQRLQNDLREVLGVELRLEPMEWKAYLGRLKGDAPALFYMGYSAPFDDAESHFKLFLSKESDNRTHYASPEYDALVAKWKSQPAGAARNKLAEQAQRLLVEKDSVVIPLVERRQVHAVRAEWKNYRVNPFGVVDLREIRR